MVDLFISCPLKVLKFDTSVSSLPLYHRTARQLEFLFILCGERYRVMDHECEIHQGFRFHVFGDSYRMALSIEDGPHWVNLGH